MHVWVHTYSTGADDYDYSRLTPFIIIKCCWTTTTEAENFHISCSASDWFLVGLIVFAKISMYFNTKSGKIFAVLLKELNSNWEEENNPTVSSVKAQPENKPSCQHAVSIKIYLNLFLLEPFKHFSLQPLKTHSKSHFKRLCVLQPKTMGQSHPSQVEPWWSQEQ